MGWLMHVGQQDDPASGIARQDKVSIHAAGALVILLLQ